MAGLGVSGFAAADALADRGAQVTAVSADATDAIRERAHILDILDVDVRIGAEHLVTVPEGTELVVTSPGLRPDHPLLVAAPPRPASPSGARSSWPGGCARASVRRRGSR